MIFEKMTEEQKNAVIEKMGDGYKIAKMSLKELGLLVYLKKIHQKKKI